MSNVVDIDTVRPHTTTGIECKGCGFRWIAVHPVGCEKFECKGCKGWVNHYGTPISKKVCTACGSSFTVVPASDTFGDECLSDDCPSYDPQRDAEIRLGFKEPPIEH